MDSLQSVHPEGAQVLDDDCRAVRKPHDRLRCHDPRCMEDACIDFRAELERDWRGDE